MAENATLIISQPGQRTRRIKVSGPVTSIGRAAGNAVCLEGDTDASRYHATITTRGDGFWLSDLGSRNGTTVNGEWVGSERKLHDGDLICIGGASTIEFRFDETRETRATAAVSPPPPAPGANAPSEKHAATSHGALLPPLPAAPQQSSGKPVVALMGVIGGLALTAVVAGILFATGVVNGEKSPRAPSGNAYLQPQPSPPSPANERDLGAASTPSPTPESHSASEAFESGVQPAPGAGETAVMETMTGAAQVLAAKISPKNYRFDPNFVRLINSYVLEYKSAAGYYERARKYRDAIDREFVNVQGIPTLFGYAMAMSRSKFVEEIDGGGVWQLSAPVLQDEALDRPVISLIDPAGSTKIAASYMRGLWDIFGREGFMYAVACYGMTLDEAGEVGQQLEIKDPAGQARYDFWRMKNAGVVSGDQVERVARFFAAGIVMENPQKFGLSEPPLSSLF